MPQAFVWGTPVIGNDYLRRYHDPGTISDAWRALIGGLGLYAPQPEMLAARA